VTATVCSPIRETLKGASSAMSGWILGRLPPAGQQRDA
jgi:hypothetical protein